MGFYTKHEKPPIFCIIPTLTNNFHVNFTSEHRNHAVCGHTQLIVTNEIITRKITEKS